MSCPARTAALLVLATAIALTLPGRAALAATVTDPVPPAKPAAPTFHGVTTTSLTVFWPEATDNVKVTGYYLQQLGGGAWSTLRTVDPGGRFLTLYGLSAGTSYTLSVIAFDAAGNLSARSDPATATTLAHTTDLTCSVRLLAFTVINTTPAAWYTTIQPGAQATLGFFGVSAGPVFQGPGGFTTGGSPCPITT